MYVSKNVIETRSPNKNARTRNAPVHKREKKKKQKQKHPHSHPQPQPQPPPRPQPQPQAAHHDRSEGSQIHTHAHRNEHRMETELVRVGVSEWGGAMHPDTKPSSNFKLPATRTHVPDCASSSCLHCMHLCSHRSTPTFGSRPSGPGRRTPYCTNAPCREVAVVVTLAHSKNFNFVILAQGGFELI